MNRAVCLLILVAAFCAGAVSPVNAQGTERADLIGRVVDTSGGTVPGATLTITNTATTVKQTTVSDQTGHFAFRFMPAGQYSLLAELPGFASVTVTRIVLQVNATVTVPIELRPAKVMESVTVEARPNAPDGSNATVKFTVTNEQIQGLPVVTSTYHGIAICATELPASEIVSAA